MARKKSTWFRRAKRKVRRKIARKVFSQCKTCGRINTPKHACRMRFTKVNAERLAARRKKYGK